MDRPSTHRKRQALARNTARVRGRGLRPRLPCGCREEVQTFGQAVVKVQRICRAHCELEIDPWSNSP